MGRQDRRDNTAQLMTEAAVEIDRLRQANAQLVKYHDHTERMLAMFEGGPRPMLHCGEAPDVAHALRRAADNLRKPLAEE